MLPRRSARDLLANDDGVVFLEFLTAFVPVWSFALGVFQLALIGQADLIVRHAADCAARSAAVVLPDDPREYGGDPQMSVSGARLETIRVAAGVPLTTLSPSALTPRPKATIRAAMPSVGSVLRAVADQPLVVSLAFPPAGEGNPRASEVTARVAYEYPCLVPLARRILCDGLEESWVGVAGKPSLTGSPRSVFGTRVRRIQHEATVLLHRAPYEYRPQGS